MSSSQTVAFATCSAARQSHGSTSSGSRGSCYEASPAFALRYGPMVLLALLRPGLLLPSFREWGRPFHPRRLSLDGLSSFTITGLSPAGLAALWAARARARSFGCGYTALCPPCLCGESEFQPFALSSSEF